MLNLVLHKKRLMNKMSVPRGWRCLYLLMRSRTCQDLTLQHSGFILFADTPWLFLFCLIDVSDDAYLTGVYVQWFDLQIILFCVLIYLAVNHHEILQHLARIRKSVADKRNILSLRFLYTL